MMAHFVYILQLAPMSALASLLLSESTLDTPQTSPLQMALSSSPPGPDCEDECREIHATLDRLSHLGQALACRSLVERRRIRETYMVMYSENLVEHLHRAKVGNPKMEIFNILYLWMLEPHERDAVVAQDALDGIEEADYMALVEIYTGRKSNQLFHTGQAYLARYRRHLDQDIISQPPHPYQKILVALASSHRSHQVEVSQHIAKCDTKRLYEAVKGAVDEPVIVEMFSKRSIPQLRLTFSSYKCIYGHSFTKALRKDRCGQFGESLRVVIKCLLAPQKHYSKMLYTCLKGSGTSKGTLSRLMLHSAESGMEEVKGTFLKKYGMNLQDAICRSVPAGDYREFLVALTYGTSSTSGASNLRNLQQIV